MGRPHNVCCVNTPGSTLAHATTVQRTPLCPEIALQLGERVEQVWREIEQAAGRTGAAVPYWSAAWPGGQALARHLLDHPGLCRGQRVLDLGTGCGIAAIAAALAGAASVEATDLDPLAAQAARSNACANGVELAITVADVIGAPRRWDVILAADLWYERFLAARATHWLREMQRSGALVLAGDPGRAYFPRTGTHRRALYEVSAGAHGDAQACVGVFELAG